MFVGGCQGKITHIYGMLRTGFDFITCPNMYLNVQPFITENNVATVHQPVLPQPSSFWLLPVPNDEKPVTGRTILGYCGDSCTVGSARQYHEIKIPLIHFQQWERHWAQYHPVIKVIVKLLHCPVWKRLAFTSCVYIYIYTNNIPLRNLHSNYSE